MSARDTLGVAIALALCFSVGAARAAAAQSVVYGDNPAAARWIEIDGAKIYYERYGSGRPVVLLHGGVFGYIDEFAGLIETLRRDHTVFAIALRGHGKSELGDKGISHERFADDAAAVIRRETREPVDVVGFSSGAMAAYRLIIRHPELVRRAVAIGGPIALAGWTQTGLAEVKAYESPDQLERLYPSFVAKRKQLYRDPRDWERLVRAFARITEEPDIPDSAVRAIAHPMLIVAGDRDEYTRTDHFVHIYSLLPHGSLAIVPACGHVVLACQAELMARLVRNHLDRPSQR